MAKQPGTGCTTKTSRPHELQPCTVVRPEDLRRAMSKSEVKGYGYSKTGVTSFEACPRQIGIRLRHSMSKYGAYKDPCVKTAASISKYPAGRRALQITDAAGD
jgi:hypothetical protein